MIGGEVGSTMTRLQWPGSQSVVMRHWRVGSLVAVLATLVGSNAGCGQPPRNWTPADRLAGLRVGYWVQLEGMARGAGPVRCSEARPLTGDFLDDDCSLKGLVQAVYHANQEFSISGCRIRVTPNTAYDTRNGTIRGVVDMRPGMVVDVEGTLHQDGHLLAAEVDDESDEMARDPRVRDEIEVTGKIERIDRRRNVVTVLGIEFQIDARTRLLSAIH